MKTENFVNTGVDLAFKLVLMNRRINVSTVAKILDLNVKYVEGLFDTLERKNMVKLNYRLFREPEVMVNEKHEEVLGNMKRVKVFDWIIECPEKQRGVMFKTTCLSCRHFKDVEGKFKNEKGNYDFRPENIVCKWEIPDAM